ncbi:hypothetical protein [Hyalangium rubrum]|uniref:Lipoprotein n=1 Tax=Hyalangium rubrum TaxID=3103134 RepID=A0ABU5H0G2_9BACT|nr:hypothetical protein [Hyalangium sp. s54d21]MDY7226938.1 hypothetical protein [Hyalangium sp. s54d21]
MHRSVATAVLSLALLALSGCKGPCRELSEKLCECSANTLEREVCIRRASNDEAFIEPTSQDEAVCEQRLETCDCNNLETDEGKIACGLAR